MMNVSAGQPHLHACNSPPPGQSLARLNRCVQRGLWAIVGTCWLVLCWPLSAQTRTLHTSNHIYAASDLLKLEESGGWTFQIEGRETSIASSQIVRWGSWQGVHSEQAVWLKDGSWLCGDVLIEGKTLSVTSDWLRTPPLALNNVRGLVLTPPTTLTRWLELQAQMLAASGEQDMLWLAGGKKLSGIIREPAANMELPQRSLALDASGQSIELSLDEIEAIVFSPTLSGPLPPHHNSVQLGLIDGSLLWATQLKPEISSVELTLDGAVQLTSLDGPRQFCKAISYLAYERAAVADTSAPFLSDLPVASYRHVADSALVWELGINRDLYGRALHTQQGIFGHGLATHSACQVAYRWDGSPARLLAEVTFAARPPQAAAALGSVNCQILLARNDQLQTAERFSLSRNASQAGQTVHLVDVDLTNAKLVVLVTDKADYGQYGDQIMWLDARLAKSQP